MRYVLLIPGWFPSAVNFLAGDFIERHAIAASQHFPVKVLFVVKDNSMPFGKLRLEHQQPNESYETFIWYYSSRSANKWMEKIFSAWLQSKCLYRGFKLMVASAGLPSLIHAHVLVKHAWFALRQSKKYNIPLLASEQWTGYLEAAKGEFDTLSGFQKRCIRNIFRHAVQVTTVSDYLAQQIKKRYLLKDYIVIPNLVDTTVFKPVDTVNTHTTFIHISTLSAQKNFDDLIEASVLLKKATTAFKLIVVAPANQQYQQRVREEGLEGHIFFRNEVPQTQLSHLIAGADALLLYSNYETFGCVIAEANACGIPVIVSDYPVFNENVKEGVTGFKVPLHDTKSLADCMMKIVNKQHHFNKEQIIRITKTNYSSEVVGKQLADVYMLYAKP